MRCREEKGKEGLEYLLPLMYILMGKAEMVELIGIRLDGWM